MLIQVTFRHLDEGVPGVENRCAIALALRDMGYKHVNVDTDEIVFRKPGMKKEIRYRIPRWVAKLIKRYDAYEDVRPFVFVLDEEVEHAHPGPN